MKKIVFTLGLGALIMLTGSVCAQTAGGGATVKFGNTSKGDESVNMDGSYLCSAPEGGYCNSPVSSGTHDFELVWSNETGKHRVQTSANIDIGDSLTVCSDSDTAVWEQGSAACTADFHSAFRGYDPETGEPLQ